jgi:hypothetical protein
MFPRSARRGNTARTRDEEEDEDDLLTTKWTIKGYPSYPPEGATVLQPLCLLIEIEV